MQISRSGKQIALLLLGLSLAGCGFAAAPSQPNGKAGTLNLSLKTVPTVRSVTISPGKATFGYCTGGKDHNNTHSAGSRLGFPNGTCWVGATDPFVEYPIKITNAGIASFIFVSGSGATPSDGGNGWSLCNIGSHPKVTCNGYRHRAPGTDQYLVQNFGANGHNISGLTGTPQCDREFDAHGKCWAGLGASQQEGIELIGPYKATDEVSTSYTMTITWTPVPTENQS
jgi:hypothetical protein